MQCSCLLFHVILCSLQIPGPTLCISHFPRFSFFLPYSRSYTEHFSISCIFHYFLLYIISYSFCVSFSTFFSFFFLPYSSSYSVHFTFSTIFRILGIFYVLVCAFFIFQVFHCFLPYTMSYNVCVSFSTFSVLCHIQGRTVCVTHFPHFYVSRHISGPTM
jgi:hypothetical protein